MRAALLAFLVVLPALAQAAPSGETRDVVVLLQPGAAMTLPDRAVELHLVHGFVLHGATPGQQQALRADPRVRSVTADEPLARTGDPNLQLTRADPAPTGTGGIGLTGRGVTVAVVDSGIDAAHPDLAGRVKANVRLVDGRFVDAPGDLDGHGTHVAGLVAASGLSSDGRWRGVAPEASLVGVDISQKFTTTSALLAYDWLYVHRDDHGLDVVVNAWGRVGERTFDADDPVIRAIDRLVDAGVVVLFSASNHGPSPSTLSVEAQDPRVVTVGAVDAAARVMSYSSRGPVAGHERDAWVKPDVVAPGEGVTGLRSAQSAPNAGDVDALHREYSGTSQAVPHVAGVVALMLEANPSLTPAQVSNALRESAVDLAAPGPDDDTGFGLVDARDAVNRAMGLAPDRGNVLVAGGVDRYEDEATLAPAPRGGLLGLVGGAPPSAWSTTFPVKTGATRLAFELAWTAPATGASVTLERDGRAVAAWSRPESDGARVVLRGRVDDPEPGAWTLRARAAAPVALEVSSVVDVQLQANATRALELDSRYRLPDATGGVFSTGAGAGAQTLLLEARLFLRANPGVVPSLAAGYMLAFLVLRRRRA